jgi:hypothetical protein
MREESNREAKIKDKERTHRKKNDLKDDVDMGLMQIPLTYLVGV